MKEVKENFIPLYHTELCQDLVRQYMQISVTRNVYVPTILRWLITVSSTFQEVDFDGSLLPLFIT